MAYKEFYFISDSEGNVTSYDVENITQNSNNIKVNFCGNYSDSAVVKLTILQANNVTLPTRIVPLTAEVYEIGEVEYRIYQYRMVQDDTKICPSATGTIKFTFTVEEDGEEIRTTIPIGLTVVQSNTSAVTNTPADTIDSVVGQLNQDTADLADLQTQLAAFDTDISGKVDKTTTIAGIDLTNNIAAQPLSDALEIDTKVQDAKNYADVNLALANSYTDEKILAEEQDIKNYTDEKLNDYQEKAPNGTDLLIDPITGVIANEYLGANIYKFAGVFYPTGIIASDARYPELNNTYIADIDINTYGGITLIYSGISESTHVGFTFKSGDFAQCLGITGWAKIDNTDAVASVNGYTGAVVLKGSDLAVSCSNTNKIDEEFALKVPLTQKAAANGVATLDANTKVPFAQIPVITWETGTVTSNAFTYDCSLNKNYKLTNSADITLTITNAYNGYVGAIRVYGGYALTLPANSILSADFGYLSALGNQNYLYTFDYDGTDFYWSRTVEGVE